MNRCAAFQRFVRICPRLIVKEDITEQKCCSTKNNDNYVVLGRRRLQNILFNVRLKKLKQAANH